MLKKLLAFFIFYLISFVNFNIESSEKLFFKLDGRTWKIGFENQDENQSITELILQDENILNWSELFTIQTFSGLNVSADELSETIEKLFKDKITDEVKNRIHFERKDDRSLNIIENSFINKNSSKNLNQSEFNIGRILKGKDTIYYIRYSTKSEEQFKESQERWIKKFKEAFISDDLVKGKDGHWFIFTDNKIFEGQKPLTYKPTIGTLVDEKGGYVLSLPLGWFIDNNWKLPTESDKSERPETIALLFASPNESIFGGLAFYNLKRGDKEQKFNPRLDYIQNRQQENSNLKIIEKGKLKTVLDNQDFYVIF